MKYKAVQFEKYLGVRLNTVIAIIFSPSILICGLWIDNWDCETNREINHNNKNRPDGIEAGE